MRAALIAGPRHARLIETDTPEPGPGEVRVRLEGCGVCGSNGPVWQGRPWFRYPLAPGAPGHEGWGRIDAAGAGVAGVEAGQRVALLSDRAFADYDVCPADAVVPLPPSLDGLPFPGEAFGCAMNVFARAGIERGDDVAIVGVGFLGAIVAAQAAAAGARVIAISRRRFAVDLAAAQGATAAIEWRDDAAVAGRVAELTDGQGCRVVVEAAGVQQALDLATRLTTQHGRLVIAGYHQDGLRTVDMQLWNWRALHVINAHERDPQRYVAGMRAAAEAIARGALDPRPLLTHSFPLAELGSALQALHERPDGFLKALVLA
jgi:2-desacetyl-2-hydroxyethyl bacteriochlorophyllide A dehydrogenase